MKLEKFNSNNMRKIVIGVLLFVGIASAIFLNTSRAKYRTTQSIPIYRGKINYKPYDFKMMAMYQANDSGEYTEIETMPSSGYKINEEKSYCYTTSSSEIDTNAKLFTNALGQHVFSNLSKNSKCYLYFDLKTCNGSACEKIMANKTINERTDYRSVVTATSTDTVYKAVDDDGDSYYFAGAATDNYVKFAGYYWRIIRINGDGTIRLIYDGTTARANGTSSTATQIGTSDFNTTYRDNMYVGYMYTSGSVHGTGTSSTIKGILDDWYAETFASYASYIDTNAGFCGDRTPYLQSGTYPDYVYASGGGTGTTTTYYGDYIRYYSSTTATPTLKCANISDLYTTGSSSKGNKALTYPIGLINMNEVWLAGGYQASNQSYYLYTGQYYWTMSPKMGGSYAYVFFVDGSGTLDFPGSSADGVRPVINLKVDTQFTGDGSINSPFTVVGAE